MGREVVAHVIFRGQTGEAKILLEADEIILRGGLRARIPRAAITGFAVNADDLVIETTEGPLRANLGAKVASLWAKALAKPPPDLCSKLGVSPAAPVQVLGNLTDPALIAALSGCSSPTALVLIAEIVDAETLERAVNVLAQAPITMFWGVTVKGKASPLPESALRTRLRLAGYVDTKSCAVSETHSATRFHRR